MEDAWARDILAQCKAAGVPAFMKQMGGKRKPFRPIPDDMLVREFPANA
jgi:protein gp37